MSVLEGNGSQTNSSTETPKVKALGFPLPLTIAYVTLYVLLFSLAFFGNIMALLTCYKKYRSSHSILLCYISSLAAADLLFAILTTFNFAYFFEGDWPGGDVGCKIVGTFTEISYTASILTLMAISNERLRSVASTSLVRNHSISKRTIFVKVVWIVALVVCTPLFYGYTTQGEKGRQLCVNTNWGDYGRQVYYALLALLIFICPLLFMLWAHIKILRVLNSRIKNSRGLATVESKQHKVTKMLAVVTLVFFFCWSPFIFVGALRHFYVYEGEEVWKLTQLMIFGNSAVNPLLYCFHNSQFRESFKEIIRCKFSLKLVPRHRRADSRPAFAMHGMQKGESTKGSPK